MTSSLVSGETAHQEHLDKMFKHIADKKFLTLILDIQSDALLVLNDKKQITYGNKAFSRLFGFHIRKAITTQPAEQASVVSEADGEQTSLYKMAENWIRGKKTNGAKEQAITDQLATLHAFGSSAQENANFHASFYC
mmetsp:Transcript_12284/g.19050  ORF Transcript_12284/g.19050 Transcript_12284/m.19050 type:complete len:137 (+) Transcript_12284:346-756(+)